MALVRASRRSRLFTRILLLLLAASGGLLRGQTTTVPTGTTPYAVAVNAFTGIAYIANQGAGTVTVINGPNTQTVSVGTQPSAIAANPLTNKIYVANRGNGTVTVIDGTNPYNTSAITVGSQPGALVVNPLTNQIYVANGGGTVSVIDGVSATVAATLTAGNTPAAIAVNPVTDKVYVANAGSGTVTVINGASATVTSTVTVGNTPVAIAADPVADKIYVANQGGNSVTIIDGSTDTASATVAVGTLPTALAVNPATGLAYVTNSGSNNVTVLNASGSVSATMSVGSAPNAVALNMLSGNIFVVNGGNGSLNIINSSTSVTKTTLVGNSPKAVAVNPVNDRAYVANSTSGNASVINGAGATVSTVNTAQQGPSHSALDSANHMVWVTNSNGTISVINTLTNAVVTTIPGVSNPSALAYNPDTGQMYVLVNGAVNVYNATASPSSTPATTIPIPGGISSGLLAVNPSVNRLYVCAVNGYTHSISIINLSLNAVIAQFDANGPNALAVDTVTGEVYIAETNSGTNVVVLNGPSASSPDSLKTRIAVGSTIGSPASVAVNNITNKVFVGGTNGIEVINGVDDSIAASLTGIGNNFYSMLVNVATNQVIAGRAGFSAITVVNGSGGNPETYTVNPVSLPVAGNIPLLNGVVDPSTNTIYYAQANGSGVVIIDGNDFTNSYVVGVGQGPSSLTLDPATGQVYVTNSGSNYVSVINGGAGFQAVPPTATVAGVTDSQTVVNPSNPNYFQTTNPTPSFTATVTSAAGFPNATALYYTVDGVYFMQATTNAVPSGSNTVSFTFAVSSQQIGAHTLYVYPAFGDESGNNSSSLGTGNSPYVASPVTLPFTILQGAVLGTSIKVTATPNPQAQGSAVTITATLLPQALNNGVYPTGTVSFTDELGDNLGSDSLPSNGSGVVTITTTALLAGSHVITATYGGDSKYTASTGTTGVVISHVASKIAATSGQPQSIVYGSPGFSDLVATVTDASDVAVSGSLVTFSGSGLNFSPTTVISNEQGLAETAVSQPSQAVGTFLAVATLAENGATANFNLAVTPAVLTVTAEDASRVYGAANPAFTYTLSGLVNGDTAAVVSGTPALSTTATAASPPGTYPITVSVAGMSAANYSFTAVNGTLTVTAAGSSSTLVANPATVMYGDTSTLTAAVPVGATGTVSFYEGSTLLGTATVDSTAGEATLPVSTLPVGTHTLTATYNGDANYSAATSDPATLTVTQRTGPGGEPGLIVTVNDATRTATQTNPPFSYSVTGQLHNGDTYATAISGTPVYATEAGGVPGSFAITLSGLTSQNYTLSVASGTLTVTQAPSTTTLAATPTTTQYGQTVTLNATVSPSAVTGTVSFYDGSTLLGSATVTSGAASLATTTLNAGTHYLTAIYNGDVTYASSQSAAATVTVLTSATPLTVTVSDTSREYMTANPQFSYTVSGTLVNGDTYATAVTGVPVYTAGDNLNSPAGQSFPITVNGLSSQNYTLIFVSGMLTIVPAASTTALTTSAASAQYGSAVTLTATVTPSTATGTVVFSNGATVLGTATISSGVATLTTSALAVGNYTLTATYNGDTNYGASVSGPVALTITPAPLTVTVSNATRPAGEGNPAFSYTISGTLYNGDAYATAVTGVPVYSTPATPASPPGTYPISLIGGLQSTNYSLTYMDGTLTVTQATSAVALAVSPATVVYGNAAALTATVTAGATGTVDFYAGATLLGSAALDADGAATLSSGVLAVGVHNLTATYSGDANYQTATSGAQALTVTPAVLTVTAVNAGRVYGAANPTFTYTLTGLVNGDTASVITGTPTLTTTATVSSPPGSYPITVSVVGMSAANYSFTAVNGTLTITAAGITTALTANPTTVIYGDTSTLTAVVPVGATGTVSFYEGSTLLGTATVDSTAGEAVLPVNSLPVGTHTLTATYNGDANYSAATSAPATLIVTQRTGPGGEPGLIITVNDATRTANQANPPFSYSVSGQLYNGDSYASVITGTPAYATEAGGVPGSFAITLSGLTSQNYTLSIVSGTLTVTEAPTTTTLTATPTSTQYGQTITLAATVSPSDATGTVSFYDGATLFGSATVAGGAASLATTTLAAGTHSITAIYNGDAIYASSQSPAVSVTVAKATGPGGTAALTVTVGDASREYMTADPQFSYTVSGTLFNSDTYAAAVTGAPVYTAGDTLGSSAGSTFPISVSGLASQNYTLTFVNGTLTIVTAPSTTTLAVSPASAQYGSAVTLTATVTPSTATGTVVFSNGATVLGTATLSGGTAALNTTALAVGEYSITAAYDGDTNYGASVSTPVALTITPAPLTVTVANATRPAGEGNPAFSYTVSGTLYNGDTYATAVAGVAVYSTPATPSSPPGIYPISLIGGLQSTNYSLTYVDGTLTITQAAATITLAVSPATVVYGNAAVLTATVTAGATGTVSFYDGATLLGQAAVAANGLATLSSGVLPVSVHTLTAAYSGDTNYQPITSTAQTLTVTPALLTATAVDVSRVYGAANPAFTYTLTGFVNGDTVAVVTGTPALSTTANAASPPGSYPITVSVAGMSSANYSFTSVNGTLTVTAVGSAATLTVSPATVMYGDPSTLTATVPVGATGTVSFYEGTTLVGTATVDSTAGEAALPVSTLPVGTHTLTATYNGDANYNAATSAPATLTVIQRTGPGGEPALIITVNDATRTDTETNPPFSYSVTGQLHNGDTYATAITGAPVYATEAGGVPGSFAITLSGLTSQNYTLSIVSGTLTVTQAPSTTTLTATPTTTQYGQTVTLNATVSPSAVTGTVSFYDGATLLGSATVASGAASLATTTLAAGTHSITAIYNGDQIYASSQSTATTVTVDKATGPGGTAALTVTVANASREYMTADPEFSYTVSGTLLNGDSYADAVTGVPVYSAGDTLSSSAGSTFPISVSGLTSQNYTLTFVNGTLTIVAASSTTALTVSPASAQYGSAVTLTATVAPAGATGTVVFTNGATVLGTATISAGTAVLTTSALAAGDYTVTASYNGDTNYGASVSTPVTLATTPAPLTVTVNNVTRPAGEGNPAFTYTVSGTLYNGDTYATAVTGVAVYSTPATPSSPPATYPISLIGGLQSANYALTYVDGTLTVTQAASTVVLAVSPAMVQYGNAATLTATVTEGAAGTVNFYAGSTLLGDAAVQPNGEATLSSGILPVGAYSVTAAYGGDANYQSATSTAQTLTVTPAVLTVTAVNASRVYGTANPAFTYTLTGLVNGDTAAVVTGTPTLTTTATVSSPPGNYPITVSVAGMSAANYSFTAVNGTLTVTAADSASTLVANPSTVMYGDTSTLTAAVPAGATGTVSFYEGSTLLGTATVNSTAGEAVLPVNSLPVGTHTLTATYNGDANYGASTSDPATLTVTQRTGPGGGPGLIITVNDATRTDTETNPPFSYSVAGQLYNGDSYATAIAGTPAYATEAGGVPGSYAITLSGLTSQNYTLSIVNGTLTVTQAPTTTSLTATPTSTQYGQTVTLNAAVSPTAATGTVSFYDGATLLGSATVSSGAASLATTTLTAGTHSITAIYNGDQIYASSQSPAATVTVAKATGPGGAAALTVTVSSASREYGAADPQFSYTVSGTLFNGDTYSTAVTGAPVYSTGDTLSSAAGSTFPISVSGLSSANYTLTFVNGTLTIVTAPSTTALTTSAASIQYGTAVTLTATVTPSTATGAVVFSNGATVLGSAAISSGTATLTTSALPVGNYTLTATYNGDTNYGLSVSTPVALAVTPAPLTVTVTNATRPAGEGNPAFSYTVSGTLYNGDTYATAVTGVPVYSTPATPSSPPATYPIALIGGLQSTNYSLTYVDGTLTVTQAASAITLAVSPATVVYGNAAALTATVTEGAAGTVDFYAGSTLLGSSAVNASGLAVLSSGVLAVGVHNLTATYSGDANYQSATSSAQALTVTPAVLTVTAVDESRVYGAANPAFTYTLAGLVNEDTAAVVTGAPTLSATAILSSPPGSYPITVSVAGMSAANYSFTAVNGTLTVTAAGSTTTLTASPATVMYGDESTLTAMVPAGATGTVSFYEGTTLLGTATVDSAAGEAVLPVSSLPVGTHTLTATYNGDANYNAATSAPATLTVTQRTGPGGEPGLIITVNDATRTDTETNPPFSYSVAGQLHNGDTYATAIAGTPIYATEAGGVPGSFAITLSGLTSQNYTLSIVSGTLTVTQAPTTTSLTATPTSTQYGQTVTLAATVSPSAATGTVSFYDGATLLGSATVSSGAASLATTTLAAGTHSITAIYNGDAIYASSQSPATTVTVDKATGPGGTAALTVTVSDTSREYMTADPQFSYTVSGTLLNSDTYATAVTGAPVYSAGDTLSSSAGSTFPITVSGLTSQNYTLNFVTGTLTIVAAPSTTTLAVSPASAQYGSAVTLTATVSPSTATGTVIFSDGATVLGSATLSSGTATLTTTALAVNTYAITATYNGDTSYGSSVSTPATLVITPAPLIVTANNATRRAGEGNPAFTYTVSSSLYNGDTYGAAVTGVSVYSTPATPSSPPGTYPISIVGGLQSANYSLTYVDGTLTITQAAASITLAVSPATVVYGNAAALTATVTAGATGTVNFYDGTTLLGHAPLDADSSAALPSGVLGVGAHTITASYSGDANYQPATSSAQTLTVTPAVLTVTAVDVSRVYGAANPAFTYTLAGLVNGDTAAVVSGTPALSTTATITSPPGNYPITVSVAGMSATNYSFTAVNGTLTITAPASDFSITSSTPSQTVPPGTSATFTILLGSLLSPYNSPVSLTVTGLPPGATYTITPDTVTPGAAGATATLIVKLPQSQAALRIGYKPIFLGMMLLPFAALRKRRRKALLLPVLLALVALGSIAGCGAGGYFSHPQQTYTITVTGSSGTLVHSTTLTLTVE